MLYSKTHHNSNSRKDKLKCFTGVLLDSEYNKLPGKRFYWDSGSDMQNELVCVANMWAKFIQIIRFLQVADNNKIIPTDIMKKLCPQNYRKNFVSELKLSSDEFMMAYYCAHDCIQLIMGN